MNIIEHQKEIAEILTSRDPETREFEPPCQELQRECYNSLHNFFLQEFELFVLYVNAYSPETMQARQEEFYKKYIVMSSSLYIRGFSVIEYYIKKIVKSSEILSQSRLFEALERTERLKNEFNPIYNQLCDQDKEKLKPIKKLINKFPHNDPIARLYQIARKIRLINESQEKEWKLFSDVRNFTVHNNMIPKERFQFIENDTEYAGNAEELMNVVQDFYIVLFKKLIRQYFQLIDSFSQYVQEN